MRWDAAVGTPPVRAQVREFRLKGIITRKYNSPETRPAARGSRPWCPRRCLRRPTSRQRFKHALAGPCRRLSICGYEATRADSFSWRPPPRRCGGSAGSQEVFGMTPRRHLPHVGPCQVENITGLFDLQPLPADCCSRGSEQDHMLRKPNSPLHDTLCSLGEVGGVSHLCYRRHTALLAWGSDVGRAPAAQ